MKTVPVTGATDGIGRATARQLLAHGWHVFVHGRSEEKAEGTDHESSAHPPCHGDLSPCGRAEAVWEATERKVARFLRVPPATCGARES